jgi:hypothetical protein
MLDSGDVEKLLRKAYTSIDSFEIKSRVDVFGLQDFIESCAVLGGGTGFAAGMAGPTSMAAFLLLDVGNCLYQELRITLAVIYHRTGRYQIGFDEALMIMAVGLGARLTSVAVIYAGKALILNIGKDELVKLVVKQILKRLPASAASKVLPGLGAVLGAGLNFGFLLAYGRTLARLDDALFGHAPPVS